MNSSSCVQMTWTNLYQKISRFQKLEFKFPRYELTSHQEFGLDWSSDIATKQGKINIPHAKTVKKTRLPEKNHKAWVYNGLSKNGKSHKI